MSEFAFKKEGYSTRSVVNTLTSEEVSESLASPEITERLEKFAQSVQRIAPRSDDFLYFTIIFLKSAESALIDEYGNTKKVGHDKAWGFFDEKYRWHGNVKPHRNNNGDIFPESELKKAARDWIGTPLCVDHKSDSVDGVRGIVLDTYYDERLKQVVGLCAVDKINYPDLARKVKTGVVRYGSMGTGVQTSICTECGNIAKTAHEYCHHVTGRSAWGEINVGLKPIEYSLVVQPAEPGAILLRTIASIKEHGQELKNFGIDDLNEFTSQLDEKQAQDLDFILHKTCGENGCSLEQRERIVRGFLISSGFIKSSEDSIDSIRKGTEALAELARAKEVLGLDDEEAAEIANKLMNSLRNEKRVPQGEALTSGQYGTGSSTIVNQDDQGVKDYTGSGSSGLVSSDSGEITDSFDTGGVGPESYLTRTASLNKEKTEIKSIMEDIMKDKKLRQRAEERRKIAYHFGGAHPQVEPATFKSEDYHKYWDNDKQMHPNPANLGGTDGMHPGDKEVKEKQSRADDQSVETKKEAYFQGGAAPAPEPATFKSEDYHKYWDNDKQMHPNPTNMGGTDGMFPGDKEKKEHQKRAAYEGPRLSTKFKKRLNLDGSLNKAASCFEVYSGDKLVIAATAKDIMGPALEKEWDWMNSKDYAAAVVAAIREEGLEKVAKLLVTPKVAQQMPEMPEAPAPEAPEAPAAPDMGGDMDLGGMDEGADEGGEAIDPKSTVDQALLDMEERIDEIRSALDKLGGGEGTEINLTVEDGGDDAEAVKLSRQILRDLKFALAESSESADELAKISESFDKSAGLSKSLKSDLVKVSQAALMDSTELLGETSTLLRMANTVADSLVKTSSYTEEETAAKTEAPKTAQAEDESELVALAVAKRRARREALLKAAMEEEAADEADDKKHVAEKYRDGELKADADDKKEDDVKDIASNASGGPSRAEDHESDAHDGIGMKENAPVAGVAKDTAEDVARKQPAAHKEHGAYPSTGNQDAQQHSDYSGTPSREVAEKSVTSVPQHHAEDDALDKEEKKEVKELAEKKVDSHEEEHHAEDEAMDKEHSALDEVKAKMQTSLLEKRAEEERKAYRIKVRRAYDVAAEMQRKGMIAKSASALDEQVDLMLEFDDKAFESFKRSVAATQVPEVVKTAAMEGLGGLNVGLGEKEQASENLGFSDLVSRLWDGK